MNITLNTNDAVSIASLSNFAQSGRDAHPELARVYLSITDGKLTALATDRYSMASYELQLDEPINEDISLSLNACKWITTNIKKTTTGSVVLTRKEDTIVIDTDNGSFTDEITVTKSGKRFFDFIEERVQETAIEAYSVKLKVHQLLKLGKLSSNFGKVDQVVQTLTPKERENRAGPVIVAADNFRVIIQPNNL